MTPESIRALMMDDGALRTRKRLPSASDGRIRRPPPIDTLRHGFSLQTSHSPSDIIVLPLFFNVSDTERSDLHIGEREMTIFEGQQKYCVTRPKVYWIVVDFTADRTTCNTHQEGE